MTAPVLVTVADAAHLSGIPRRTLHRWAAAGTLTDHTQGGRRMVDYTEVQTRLDQRLTNRTGHGTLVCNAGLARPDSPADPEPIRRASSCPQPQGGTA